jgi:hypothetical protein
MGKCLALTLSIHHLSFFFCFSGEFMFFSVRWSFGSLQFLVDPVVWGKRKDDHSLHSGWQIALLTEDVC